MKKTKLLKQNMMMMEVTITILFVCVCVDDETECDFATVSTISLYLSSLLFPPNI